MSWIVSTNNYAPVFALSLFIIFVIYKSTRGYNDKTPTAHSRFLVFGNTIELLLNIDRINELLYKLSLRYGSTFRLHLFAKPTIIVTSDPKNIEHVLKTNFENYVKGNRFHQIFECLLGNGIFNVDGMLWYQQRKSASHMFSAKNFRDNMQEVFIHHGHKVVDILGQKYDQGITFDLQELMYRFTLDSITQIAFGENVKSLDSEEVVLFAKAFDTACRNLVRYRIPVPTPVWKFLRFIRFSGEVEIDQATNLLNKYAENVISRCEQAEAERVKEKAHGNEMSDEHYEHYNIISVMLRQGEKDHKVLRDTIMSFIIAGRDTTAVALNWTFYCLSENPESRKKMIEEIDSVLQGEEPTYDSIKDLVYTNAVLYETLRLFPSVSNDMKYAVKHDTLPSGTLVSPGNTIFYSPYVMGRDKTLWEDPLCFNPDRWIKINVDNSRELIQFSPFVFNTFHAGPRVCLGKAMATTEAIILLSMVHQKYTIKSAIVGEARPAASLTMPMLGGHPVYVVAREQEYHSTS